MTPHPVILDIAALEARIAEGLQNDHSWPFDGKARGDAFAALDALVSEVERLRAHRESSAANLLKGYETGKAEERAAVVPFLRAGTAECRYCLDAAVIELSNRIERGEHRKKEAP